MEYKGKITVLSGGIGSEREISLESGKNALGWLLEAGANADLFDVRPENASELAALGTELFLPMLHGEWGEDGQIQKILEGAGLCFAGSGSAASALCFDKQATKDVLAAAGIAVPFGAVVESPADLVRAEELIKGRSDRYVVKPAAQGSSVGVEVRVGSLAAVRGAESCLAKYGKTVIEEFVEGREFTVGVVDGVALPAIEIKPVAGFYDFTAKYISDETEFLFGTAGAGEEAKMQEAALEAFYALGCRDFARVDFIMRGGIPVVLEVNTLPGFTSHSLLPKAAARAGQSGPELCERIVNAALGRYR